MLPYFYQLTYNPLTTDETESISTMYKNNTEKFVDYVSLRGDTDNNTFLSEKRLPSFYRELPMVKSLINRCTLATFAALLKHKPGITVPKHVDDFGIRRTVLSFPITPIENYSPTYFWKSMDDTTSICMATFDMMLPCLLNTQQIHGLTNSHTSDRVNLQLCFSEPIEVVAELAENKKLFR